MPLLANSDDFVFDNQMLTQAVAFDFSIGEISCPTKYFPEASSINFRRSITYGVGVLSTSIIYRLWQWGIIHPKLYSRSPTLLLKRTYYSCVEPVSDDLHDVRLVLPQDPQVVDATGREEY